MNKETNSKKAIHTVRAQRINTGDGEPQTNDENVDVIVEAPLLIDVQGVETYTVLCTPIDKRAMAIGFLYSEAVIDGLQHVTDIYNCKDEENTVRVKLTGDIPRLVDPGRNLLIVSSCGACGTEGLDKRLENLPRVGDTLRIESQVLKKVNADISGHQTLFNVSGGTHIVGIFDRDGKILACAEDTGRHNALDKAVGKCLFEDIDFRGCGAMLSGRVSLEMVTKCSRAGIELISAISAPTSYAIETADRLGITLCAFVREDRATVFTHERRII